MGQELYQGSLCVFSYYAVVPSYLWLAIYSFSIVIIVAFLIKNVFNCNDLFQYFIVYLLIFKIYIQSLYIVKA